MCRMGGIILFMRDEGCSKFLITSRVPINKKKTVLPIDDDERGSGLGTRPVYAGINVNMMTF